MPILPIYGGIFAVSNAPPIDSKAFIEAGDVG